MSAIALPNVVGSKSPPQSDDLLALAEGKPFELVDGVLTEKPAIGFYAAKVAGELYFRLGSHVRTTGQGEVVFETSFQCFPHKPTQTRRPDIAFVVGGRLAEVPNDGHVPIRPDLAVEVLSPGDRIVALDEKLDDYEAAGIPLVWVLKPERRRVLIYRAGQPIDTLREADTLDGGAVLPGFAVAVRDLFPPRAA